jgi:hypothetical protein
MTRTARAVTARVGMAVLALLLAVLGPGVLLAQPARAAVLPGPPVTVRAVPGDASLTVTWGTGPDGGSPVTGYVVQAWYGSYYPVGPEVTVPATTHSATVATTNNGSEFRAAVWAVTAVGRSTSYTWSNDVVSAGVPQAPPALDVDQREDGAVRVSWTPAYPNGAEPSSYTVTDGGGRVLATIDARAWNAAPPDPQGAGYFFADLRGLRTGVELTVSVTATNSAGTGPASSLSFQLERYDEMGAGQVLHAGEELRSPNGRYSLEVQVDGNVVVYADDVRPLWHTHTWRPDTELDLQYDGNLVSYDTYGYDTWNAGTFGNRDARLVMQDDGNLVLYGADGTPLWFSGWDRGTVQDTLLAKQDLTVGQSLVSRSGQYQLLMQADGNLVVYGPGKRALWHIGVHDRGGNRLRLQADGNAVVYQFNWLVNWHAGTWGNANVRMVMQDDGNLVVYAANGRALWSSMFGRTY